MTPDHWECTQSDWECTQNGWEHTQNDWECTQNDLERTQNDWKSAFKVRATAVDNNSNRRLILFTISIGIIYTRIFEV